MFGISLAFVTRFGKLFLSGAAAALLLGAQQAAAQATSPSAGCTAANAGDYDFSLPTGVALTSSPFTADFTAGEVLTFALSAGGGGVNSATADDTTDSIAILNTSVEASTDYSIPASGSRDFNLEMDTVAGDFFATLSVSCAPAQGTIVITKASDVDGDFNFAGDLGNFTISVSGEPGSASFSNIFAGTYVVSEALSPEFDLSGIVCTGDSDGGSLIDVNGGEVAIDLDAGETVICTFTNSSVDTPPSEAEVVEVASHTIRNFLYRRASALLNEQPDRARIVRKNPGLLWSDAADIRIQADANGVDAKFAMSTGEAWVNDLDVWIEGRYSAYNGNNGADVDGDFGVVYLGTDYLLTDNLLIGVLGQLDWASERSEGLGETIDGNGWMAGPYLSAKLDKNLFFDARVAWGRSSNDLSIDGFISGDEFETSRWLMRGALTGNRQFGNWRVTPTASIAYIEERQEGFASTTGAFIGGQTVALGRAAIEPEVAYRYVTQSGILIEPQLTLAGVWDFETPSGLSIPGWSVSAEKFRARIEGAVLIAFKNGYGLRMSGAYDGIGASGYSGYSARLWFDVPMGARMSRRDRSAPAPALKQCADGSLVPLTDGCPSPAPTEFVSEVSFAAGKANLSSDAYGVLSDLFNTVSGYDIDAITIAVGGGGDGPQNRALAARRASVVKNALIGLGAPAPAITVMPIDGAAAERIVRVTIVTK
ncbi:MAG: autotransporter domain-containing protein [Alphaproteobacteria bacterium]|nr:autotransporter domain-containing protein [Alphaproteobacteria bacterium]